MRNTTNEPIFMMLTFNDSLEMCNGIERQIVIMSKDLRKYEFYIWSGVNQARFQVHEDKLGFWSQC